MAFRSVAGVIATALALAAILAAGCGPKVIASSEVLERDIPALDRLVVIVETPQLDSLVEWWRDSKSGSSVSSVEFADGISGAVRARLVQALSAAGADVEGVESRDLDLTHDASAHAGADLRSEAILLVREEAIYVDQMTCTRAVLEADLLLGHGETTRRSVWRARTVLASHNPRTVIRMKEVPENATAAILTRLRSDGLMDLFAG